MNSILMMTVKLTAVLCIASQTSLTFAFTPFEAFQVQLMDSSVRDKKGAAVQFNSPRRDAFAPFKLLSPNGRPLQLGAKKEAQTDASGTKFEPGSKNLGGLVSRRTALLSLCVAAATTTTLSRSAHASEQPQASLEDISLGNGAWISQKDVQSTTDVSALFPASFATYASRILINYDPSVSGWWSDQKHKVHLLSHTEQRDTLGKQFGCLAQSVSSAFQKFIMEKQKKELNTSEYSRAFAALADVFLARYSTGSDRDKELIRHVGILFSLLPPKNQPRRVLNELSSSMGKLGDDRGGNAAEPSAPVSQGAVNMDNQAVLALSASFTESEQDLLPHPYTFEYSPTTKAFLVTPETVFWEIGVGDEDKPTEAIGTVFGPIATTPLTRQKPTFGLDTYALLGVSGGVGCALTHSVVIPLDVVKTRMQTDADEGYTGMLDGAISIVNKEGAQALFLGAQATIAGYLWYGISVYPTYTFFKKMIGESLLDPAVALLQSSSVSLLAGALAAVVASIGLTPLEACRIRTVAEPDKYRPLGLAGTASDIAAEDPQAGWATLYAGFNSLLTRQVIFGSVKFLAFERACEAIYHAFPGLKDATATALLVSLVAGGLSGTVSSVVSQPADSVLTYVAQRGEGLGVIKGCRVMIEEEGPGSLFRGLGSRCVWAGSIIAGQFFLYDIFRTFFGVNGEDLSQVFNVVIDGR